MAELVDALVLGTSGFIHGGSSPSTRTKKYTLLKIKYYILPMQIKELKSKDLQKEFQITIPSKDIAEKLNKKLLEISETSEVEGFRKGKVPINILKQKFGQSALDIILEDSIKSSSNELISKNNLKLATKPKVDVKKFGEETGLEYIISLELIPDISIEDTKKIKLIKYVSLVSEDDLNQTLDNIMQNQIYL